MAQRISTSNFLASTMAQQAAQKDLDKPLPQGGGPLPAGIKGGVAKLTTIYFETDETGEESFRAEAEVVFPDVFNGQYLKGKKTKQWISFNAENLEDRIPRIRDILKYLGGRAIFGDGKQVNFIQIAEFLDKATKRAPIYFGFSTTAKESGEWPWENWYPAIPGFVAPVAGSTASPTSDQKKTNESRPVLNNGHSPIQEVRYTQGGVTTSHSLENGIQATVAHGQPNTNGYQSAISNEAVGGMGHDNADQPVGIVPGANRVYVPNTSPNGYQSAVSNEAVGDIASMSRNDFAQGLAEVEYNDGGDLDTLIKRASNDDATAKDKLAEFAKALGYTDDDLDESASWEQVGRWIRSGNLKDSSSVNPNEVTKPKREVKEGQVYKYEPLSKTNPDKRLKERECRVMKIVGSVVTLQNLAKKDETYEVEMQDEFLK